MTRIRDKHLIPQEKYKDGYFSLVIWSTSRFPAVKNPENKQVTALDRMHLPPIVSVEDYAHCDTRHDVTTCYANTIQKHWIHNVMSTADRKREKKPQTNKKNRPYKNQNTMYTTKTRKLNSSFFCSLVWLCDLFTSDGNSRQIFLSVYLQVCICFLFIFLVVNRGSDPDLILLWINQQWVQNDAVSRVKACKV